MFESLGNRLQDILDNLRKSSTLTEAQVKAAMREIRMALLEADVNFGVAKDFVARVSEKAVGQEVLGNLQAGQQVVKVVHDELIETLGGKAQQPNLKNEGNVFFLVGLQGAGKTTSAGKLASHYKSKGRRVLLVAADTQRPAAREQLRTLGQQVGVPVLEVADHEDPVTTRTRLAEHLQKDYRDLIIVDTAGRLQIDEALMDQLADLKGALSPTETLLVVDAMTGQEALNVAQTFESRIGLSGLIMTKLDGDARGGAALSARFVTGKPIYFAGVSEKLSGLEPFYPDRIAGRILGMGDVLSLIERAQQAEIEATLPKKPGEFDLEDLLTQLRQIRKMGPLGDLLKMIPGMSRMLPSEFNVDEKQIQRIDAMISSMTLKERRNPKIIDGKRRKRIAQGSGVQVQDINRLLKMHEQMKEMMKVMQKMGMGGKGGKMPKLPFGPGGPRA
ncbi:signal recognition particle protein [Deinococcus peraridilitoris]|uniref:Signal recognition particle protein n=1 Tax=Deinococcus peraridilitoris (strain DSM 19664 / LMG 22246 / CIP 109416 / KR-200) TaxID=937777 RepID=K9ZX78_DEIPD|nr:signal recognition particle protein [Deinococcus peraridilitoris]AFZ66166.1 signal recognition particle protein [Deinococcus peraridilitoris DSM 19664]